MGDASSYISHRLFPPNDSNGSDNSSYTCVIFELGLDLVSLDDSAWLGVDSSEFMVMHKEAAKVPMNKPHGIRCLFMIG